MDTLAPVRATPRIAVTGMPTAKQASFAGCERRQRDGSRPTTSHQNRQPETRKCRWVRS
jgi:hypothetical protein